MKKLSLLFLLFLATYSNAQNYQCLQSGVKHYFINGNGYLRGIRIDSARTVGSDSVFYPFRTKRQSGHYIWLNDWYGGSWLGKKVIMKSDGTFLFDNCWKDTVFIKTLAHPGDSWLFFKDSSVNYYTATVNRTDTMTILGSLDSIKRITLTSYSGSIINTSDSLNNFEIILSKNHGFVKVFDLYTFPYHHYDESFYTYGYVDVYLDSVCGYEVNALNSLFYITDYHNPSEIDIYDFDIGDGFYTNINNSTYPSAGSENEYFYDSIIGKTIVDLFHVKYDVYTRYVNNYYSYRSWGTASFSGSYTDSVSVDTTPVIKLIKMPEEGIFDSIYYYLPNDTTFCHTSKFYKTVSMWRGFDCGATREFKAGFMDIYHDSCWVDGSLGELYQFDLTLLGASKDGISCGMDPGLLYTLNVSTLVENHFALYPNPSATTLTITSSNRITQITLLNLLGQIISNQEYNTEKVELNIADLPPGVYFVKINGTEVRKFVKE